MRTQATCYFFLPSGFGPVYELWGRNVLCATSLDLWDLGSPSAGPQTVGRCCFWLAIRGIIPSMPQFLHREVRLKA